MNKLEFEDFENLARKGNVIPVYVSFIADLMTPVLAFLRLQKISDRAFLYESVEGGEKFARYTFLGCNPFRTLSYKDNKITEEAAGAKRVLDGGIFDYLDTYFEKYKTAHPPGLPRFTGGAVGYFGYETIHLLEKIPANAPKEISNPDALLMLFKTVVVFDRLRHEILIITNVFLDDGDEPLRSKYDTSLDEIQALKSALEKESEPAGSSEGSASELVSNFTKEGFCKAVEIAKDYITAGDIFQVVISQEFQRTITVDPFMIYRALRVINPSPYLYYLKMDDLSIIGSSPELLVRLEDGIAEVRPIAGTRPRGRDSREDEHYMRDLRNDAKELAEHVMLLDLGRNDLGRVSEYGSVEVTEKMLIEKYSHVMHLVSNVRGRLKPGLSAIDALKACFPAGTVSGAPKISAMEIIQKLEPHDRGVYAGGLGYFDFSGNLDTCIAIRTIVTKGNKAYFQAGAGIVADSVPENEYQETLNKASALKAAIEFAERGLQ